MRKNLDSAVHIPYYQRPAICTKPTYLAKKYNRDNSLILYGPIKSHFIKLILCTIQTLYQIIMDHILYHASVTSVRLVIITY